MKNIINTTGNAIEVQIFGATYRIEGNGSLIAPTKVAEYWQDNLHEFLILEDVVVTKAETKTKEVEAEVTPVETATVEEDSKSVKKTTK